MTEGERNAVRLPCYMCGKMIFAVTAIRDKGHCICGEECYRDYKEMNKPKGKAPKKKKKDDYEWLHRIERVLKANNGKYVN